MNRAIRSAVLLLACLGSVAAGGDDVGWTLPALPAEPDAASPDAVDRGVTPALYEAGRSPADADRVLERLSELEADHQRLRSEYEELGESLDACAKGGVEGGSMSFSGRIHADMWAFPGDSPGVNGFETGDPDVSPQDRLAFRRVRLDAEGDLPIGMVYKFEIELAGGEDSEFRDVYAGWDDLPILQQLLVGNQKRPYGLDHLNSSRFNVFLERPYVIESFNQDNRRLGVQSYGVSDDLAWNWRYGVFNQRLIQDEGAYVSDHWQSQVAGRLANTLWWHEESGGRGYAHWAIAGTWANTDQGAAAENFAGSGINEARFAHRPEARSENRWLDTGVIAGADDYTLLAFESVLNVGATQIVAEHQNLFLNRVGGAESLYLHGGYVYVSYFLTGEHIPWDRRTGTIGRVEPFENFFLVDCGRCGRHGYGLGAWQIALRWSYADLADRDLRGGDGEALTAALNWHWTPYAKVQMNYLYGEITDNDLNAPAGAPNFGDYHILGARFAVDF